MDVTLPAPWLAGGQLPMVCARHGGPSSHRAKRSIHTKTPSWVFLIMLCSLLIGAIVALSIRKTVKGQLSACSRCTTDRRRFRAAVVAAWVLSAVLLGVVGSSPSDFWVVLWTLFAIGALTFTFCGDLFRVRGHLRPDLVWVDLKGVHEDFARPVMEALRPPVPAGAAPVLGASTGAVNVLPGG